MSNGEPNRLDRIEAILEEIATTQVEFNNRINSNAKAIEALSDDIGNLKNEWQKDREEWRKDRKVLYQFLSRVARSQSDFYETQADFYARFDEIDERQARMLEIMDRFLPREEN